MTRARARQTLAALAIATTLGGCATASTYAFRSKLRSSPGLVVLTMGGGLLATSIVSWKLLNVGEGSYRPTIFVPVIVVVDLLGSVGAVMSILSDPQ